MIDIANEIAAVQRETGTGRLGSSDARTVILRRTYAAPVDEVWDALTDPARIGRWFLPISGDFRLGGTYQFEGNSGGEIVACDAPNRLKVTWMMGPAGAAPPSEVEVRLRAAGDDRTELHLEHVAVVPDEFWDLYGPGASASAGKAASSDSSCTFRAAPSVIRSPGRCRRRVGHSTRGAAWPGARRAAPRAPTRRRWRERSRTRRRSTRRIRTRPARAEVRHPGELARSREAPPGP